MRTTDRVTVLAALVCTSVAVIWWLESSKTAAIENTLATPSGDVAQTGAERAPLPAPVDARREVAPPDAATHAVGSTAAVEADGHGHEIASEAYRAREEPTLHWPMPRGRGTGVTATAAAEPGVPVKLAFRALWYLGVDPEAERTWRRAINDPNMPPGVRSDLIVDMIDEGYTDNNHPTAADLPVILARLEILQRHAPYAMDEVNRVAFQEAYRHLLELYIRLGGKPDHER